MNHKLPISDSHLLEKALTHRSYLNEHKNADTHNERLEFLGDAVLELAVSEYLFKKFPTKPEGDLTAYRASLVRTTTLAIVSQQLNLGDMLRLSKGEEMSGGRKNKSLLANTFEAVVGAIYLDKDYQTVQAFLTEHLFPQIDRIIELGLFKDYKGSLQELVQAKGYSSPDYKVTKETGPDHSKEFTISVLIDGKKTAEGSGKSKQTAQQQAARRALELMKQS